MSSDVAASTDEVAEVAAPLGKWGGVYTAHMRDEGDHIIFIGEVEHCERTEALPLVYHAGGYDLTPNLQK